MITPGTRATYEAALRSCLIDSGASAAEADEAVSAWRLGTFIYQQNPYGEGLQVTVPLEVGNLAGPATLDAYIAANQASENLGQLVPIDGHAWRCHEGRSVQFSDIRNVPINGPDDKVSLLNRILDTAFWYFRGKPFRVIKTLAISYTFKNKTDAGKTFLFVGYHGQGCD